jgi:hypothetical protein
MVMVDEENEDLEGVSMRRRGTESVKELVGKRVGGSNGGTVAGKESEAMAEMRVDFPVDLSPTRTILSSLGKYAIEIAMKREQGVLCFTEYGVCFICVSTEWTCVQGIWILYTFLFYFIF